MTSLPWEDAFNSPALEEPGGIDLEESEEEREQPQKSKSVQLYELLQDEDISVFRDEDTSEYLCRYQSGGHSEIEPLHGNAFFSFAVRRFYEATGRTISQALARESFLLLQAGSVETRKTYTRLGRHGESIYIDLCDEAHRAVEIDAEGWRTVTNPPVMFRRGAYAKPLPQPCTEGSLEWLKTLTNFASEDDYILTVGWLAASMNPDGPFPILALSAEHGAGKSTLTTLLGRLLDPQATERLAPLKDADALFSAAAARWIVPLDNCGKIGVEMSDHFCRLATGGGLSKRQLYTDNGSFSVNVTRPLILNGIALSLGRMDLLDRAYCVQLMPVPEGKRRTEAEIYREFEEIHSRLLGALCTALYGALREASYKPKNLPRMADGATLILRAERGGGLPWEPGTFAEAITRREAQKIDDALSDDVTGAALLKMFEGFKEWKGTASKLLEIVASCTSEDERFLLPKLPRTLSTRLEELAPLLRAKGIEVRKERTDKKRLWLLERRGTSA